MAHDVEEVRVAGIVGIAVGRDGKTGEDDVTAIVLLTEDGRRMALRIGPENALNSAAALISSLSSAAQGSSSFRIAIPTSAWHAEAGTGGGVLHAYLTEGGGARLSFGLEPEHMRPLAQRLLALADETDRQSPVPAEPLSTTRN